MARALGAAREQLHGRAAKAMAKLETAIGQGGQEFGVLLLEVLADEMTAHGDPDPVMPTAERQSWERLGADFSDDLAIHRDVARRAARYAELLRDSMAGDEAVAQHLGVGRSRVSQRVSAGELYWLTGPDGVRYFPSWQFRKGSVLPGLQAVLRTLDPGLHPLSVSRWFTTPHDHLLVDDVPVSPSEWLATGGDPRTLAALAELA